jgi:hypothetical protein
MASCTGDTEDRTIQILARGMLEQQCSLARDMEVRFTKYFRKAAIPDFDLEPSTPGS